MFEVSVKGDWTGWLRSFLEVCRDTCSTSVAIIDQLISLQGQYREAAMNRFRSNNILILIDQLFETPVVSAPMVMQLLGVTHRAARMTISNLEELGILEKVSGPAMPQYYAARSILRAGD